MIAHLNRSAGIGPDHQLVLPVGLSEPNAADESAPPLAASASLDVPGAVAANFPGIDISAPSQLPQWESGARWSEVVLPLRSDGVSPGEFPLTDARAESEAETFLLQLEGDDAIRP